MIIHFKFTHQLTVLSNWYFDILSTIIYDGYQSLACDLFVIQSSISNLSCATDYPLMTLVLFVILTYRTNPDSHFYSFGFRYPFVLYVNETKKIMFKGRIHIRHSKVLLDMLVSLC